VVRSPLAIALAVSLVLLLLVVGGLGLAARGPWSLRAEYRREVAKGLARALPEPPVTEADLAPLPAPVQRYLRLVGVVGRPRVRNFRVRFTGRMRGGPDAPWMPLTADQHSFLEPLTRLFFMEATRGGLPVVALHAYRDGGASMRVKLLSLVKVVDARGADFTRAETVTLFNDLCVLAPAALIDPAAIRWEPVDDAQARATFTHAGHAIQATLLFGEDGLLKDFTSDDRPALAPDGVHFLPARWSTPLGAYRAFGPYRLAGTADVRYRTASADYAYGEFVIADLAYNVGAAD